MFAEVSESIHAISGPVATPGPGKDVMRDFRKVGLGKFLGLLDCFAQQSGRFRARALVSRHVRFLSAEPNRSVMEKPRGSRNACLASPLITRR